MTEKRQRARKVRFNPSYVRDLGVEVYKRRLSSGDMGKRMIEEDADGGAKLRSRAAIYDEILHEALRALYEQGSLTAEAIEAIITKP